MAAEAPSKSTEAHTHSPAFSFYHHDGADSQNRSVSMVIRVLDKPTTTTTHLRCKRLRNHISTTEESGTPSKKRRSGRLGKDERRSAIKKAMIRMGATAGNWVMKALGALTRASYRRSGWRAMRQSAIKKSLMRTGAKEGDWVKKALSALIRPSPSPSPSCGLDMRRTVIKNSLMRSGAVEGNWVKMALGASMQPSSPLQRGRRRREFLPRPSPLSVMTMAQDFEFVNN